MEDKPLSKETLAHLAEMNKQCADNFTGWTDLYARLRAPANIFIDEPCFPNACAVVATLLAFTHALEEMPDEGDVVVIARRLNEILVTRPDILGFELLLGKAAEECAEQMKAADAARVRDAVDRLKEFAGMATTAGPEKTLH